MANPHVLQDQIDELFIQWKRREGRNASVEQLVVAARTEGLDDLLVRAGLSGEFDNMLTCVTGKAVARQFSCCGNTSRRLRLT